MSQTLYKILVCVATANLAFYSCNIERQRSISGPVLTNDTKGLTFVAPPEPFIDDPMRDIISIGANSIAVVPYAFTPPGKSEVHFDTHHQWWGESPEGVIETIRRAHHSDIKVMLKPQVWSHGHWTGDYSFDKPDEWKQWESQYQDYIIYFARVADSLAVEWYCIGTEFKTAIRDRPKFWTDLIDSVRNVYSGKITYAANWDNYDQIPFWDQLDVIGINAYFPLSEAKTPTVRELMSSWDPIRRHLDEFHSLHSLPILFTEYGYLSVDGCAYNTWDLEGKVDNLPINEQAQANAIEALHRTFYPTKYWQGGFLWKWFPNMRGHEGYPARDYTPQGKVAEQILSECFKNKT